MSPAFHRANPFFAWLTAFVLFAASLWPASATAQTASSPQPLTNGANTGPISGALSSQRYYSFTVPAGSTQATFAISGGTGDSDMYVRHGAVPTQTDWAYRPYLNGSDESVSITNPQAGTWYVMLRGYTAYSGVYLKATSTTPAATAAATPTFSPQPGSYSGRVSVLLASATANAVIRYTLDGTAPTASSEVYAGPIVVSATTTVNAVAFANGLANSAVASGTYTIRDAVQTLTNNTPIANLSGAKNSVANFRFAVPSGAVSVSFSISGGTGDADMYVKYGQLATTSNWDQRPYTGGNNESVVINPASAGDYFVMVHGYKAYSGLTIKATYSGTATTGKPDLVLDAAGTNPYVATQTFAATDCEISEGTITAGTKKLLRFTTQTRNIGTADFILGSPSNNPSFEWGACHGHYHFNSFAKYRLLDTTGSVVRNGHKMGFCLMDITRVDSAANPSARYTCSNQGIQAGWADIYSANLSGQWIDITGLPAGQYVLEITMDPLNLIDELDETNNIGRINVTVP